MKENTNEAMVRKLIHEQNGSLTKEIETIKKNALILKFKNTMKELKNSTESFNSRLDHTEELGNLKAGHWK